MVPVLLSMCKNNMFRAPCLRLHYPHDPSIFITCWLCHAWMRKTRKWLRSLFPLWNREGVFGISMHSFNREKAWILNSPKHLNISLSPTKLWPSPDKKIKYFPEKHLLLQGPSSHVTLNRFMFGKCKMSPEEPRQNYSFGYGICLVDPYHWGSGLNHISSLCLDPTFCLGGFCTFKLNHETSLDGFGFRQRGPSEAHPSGERDIHCVIEAPDASLHLSGSCLWRIVCLN